MKCHQRKIRDEIAAKDDRPVIPLAGCFVEQITREQAESVIFVYEWLGTMPSIVRACYGLFSPGHELLGVAVFGNGGGSLAANLCGKENRTKAICLERGACVHYAHPHAGSFLVANACKMAADDYGWRIFYAYSDVEAGEIGTIYQACNWHYLGGSPGRGKNPSRFRYWDETGKKVSSRSWRRRRKNTGEPLDWDYWAGLGWKRDKEPVRHKYCNFYGGDKRERRVLLKALKYPPLDYPKRGST